MGTMLIRKHYIAGTNTLASLVDNEDKVVEPQNDNKSYSKTEINRMNRSDLLALTSLLGISVAEDETGSTIKKKIIEFLGL